MAEADRINSGVILGAVVVTVAALIAMVVGVSQLFEVTIREEIDKKVLSVESTQLRQLRVEEQHKITSYQWVDQRNGVVRVPVERAVELILAEGYKRPAPVAAPAPAAPGAPAGAPAPAAAPAAPAKPAAPAPAAPAPAKPAAPAPAAGGAH